MKMTVTAIGAEAVNEEPLLIFFDNTATKQLRRYAIIQEKQTDEPIELVVGGNVCFDDQVYQIQFVGEVATRDLNAIGHITMAFTDVPQEDRIANGIYLTPHQLPSVKEGMTISYQEV